MLLRMGKLLKNNKMKSTKQALQIILKMNSIMPLYNLSIAIFNPQRHQKGQRVILLFRIRTLILIVKETIQVN